MNVEQPPAHSPETLARFARALREKQAARNARVSAPIPPIFHERYMQASPPSSPDEDIPSQPVAGPSGAGRRPSTPPPVEARLNEVRNNATISGASASTTSATLPSAFNTPTTPTGRRRPPSNTNTKTPKQLAEFRSARTERLRQTLANLPAAEEDGGIDSSPIPAPNFGPPVKKVEKPIPSPTESSPVPPTTKRAASYPSLGDSEEYKFIGFDPQLQALMNKYELSWAVQYEISRFRSQSTAYCFNAQDYETILPHLKKRPNDEARHVIHHLRSLVRMVRENSGSGSQASDGSGSQRDPAVASELESVKRLAEDLQRTETDPYVELDHEEKAIQAANHAGLGLTQHGPKPEWYGGRVCQIASLVMMKRKAGDVFKSTNPSAFTLVLRKHKIGRSTRVSRTLGSRRLIQVSCPESIVTRYGEELAQFFAHKFVVNGRVFEAVCAKEKTVYLLETGDYDEGGAGLPSVSHLSNNGRVGLRQFMEWHNPVMWNQDQAMSKWAARFSLAFSTSVPACRVEPFNMIELADIRPSLDCLDREIMTDGCGYMNKAVATHVQHVLNLKYLPSAVQARVCGVKGMFLLHPDDAENKLDTPKLWCRPSQIKVQHGPYSFVSTKPEQLTLDLLRYARPKMPAHLSKEFISNLAYGGVSSTVLERIFLKALAEHFTKLSNWEGPDALVKLWRAVFDTENVLIGRLRRESAGASRAFGFGDIDDVLVDLSLEPVDDDNISEMSVSYTPDVVSGLPSSLAEQILSFLSAGFEPGTAPVLKSKLDILINASIKLFVTKYHVAVPSSVEGHAAPDPLGVLEEGEIYFRSSEQWQGEDGRWLDTLEGDVLVSRHPCKVPSDIQKLRAVDRPELRGWANLVIFSIKGRRSEVGKLGGGDFDGDTVVAIFDPDIVKAFTNAPLRADGTCLGDPSPTFIADNFDKSIRTVRNLLESTPDQDEVTKSLQRALLAPLANESVVGAYSNMHEKSAYKKGYGHEDTILMAQKFCTVLDGGKSGLTIKKEVRKRDRAEFEGDQLPPARNPSKPGNAFSTDPAQSPQKRVRRPPTLGDDIIETLYKAGDQVMVEYRQKLNNRRGHFYDPALKQPYEATVQRARGLPHVAAELLRADIAAIESAVQHARSEYDNRVSEKSVSVDWLPYAERQDLLRTISAELRASLNVIPLNLMSSAECFRVAASYAYVDDMERYNEGHRLRDRGTEFPFQVMFRELADIHARSTGKNITITSQFHDRFVVHPSFLRLQ